MTEAEQVEAEIHRMIAAGYAPVSLTRIVTLQLPVRLDFLWGDEIQFVYQDGSAYRTGLVNDDEQLEATALRRLIAFRAAPSIKQTGQ